MGSSKTLTVSAVTAIFAREEPVKTEIHRLIKGTILAAALVAAASGVAHADDSSMSPFTGDSYAYFNGGSGRAQIANADFDNGPSAWRQDNPQGLPERVFQSYSSAGEAWNLDRPVFAGAPVDASFKETHPNGLTEPELQALSSDAFGWRLGSATGAAGIVSPDYGAVAEHMTKMSAAARIAALIQTKP